MIQLYQFTGLFGLPNLSPFCMKLECYLRMSGLEYQVVTCNDPRKAPNNKLPFIRCDGQTIGDSTLIIQFLENKYNLNTDAHLDDTQRAISQAFLVMLEHHLYWAALYSRWIDNDNWPQLKAHYFGKLPPGVRQLAAYFVRKRLHTEVYEQGLGRHDKSVIYDLALQDIDALARYLGDKDYFHGTTPSLIDAAVFSYVGNILVAPFTSPMKNQMLEYANLVAYSQRMYARYFPELLGEIVSG